MDIKNNEFKNFNKNLIFLLSIGSFYPLVFMSVLFQNFKTLISFSILGLIILYIFKTKRSFIFPKKNFFILCLIQIIFFIIYSFIHDSFVFISTLYTLLLSYIYIFIFLNFLDSISFLRFFIKFNILSLFFCLVGVFLYSMGLLPLISVTLFQDDNNIYNYGLFFIKRVNELTEFNIRPAGYYDEPGSFSFVVMLLLLINKKFFDNKKWEFILLFFTFVTTSLAHIFTVILYLLLFYFNFKNFKKLIFVIFFVFGLLTVIKSSDNEYIKVFNSLTIDRVDIFISGEDKSRKAAFDLGPMIFSKNIFGQSQEKVLSEFPDFVVESYWGPLIFYGILGIWFYYLPFIYIFLKSLLRNDKFILLSIILIFFNFLQRPSYIYILYIMLFYILFFFDFNKKKYKN